MNRYKMTVCGACILSVAACSTPQHRVPPLPIETINLPNARTLGPYSQAVRAGDYLFLSGVIALNANDGKLVGARIEPQTRQVFKNIQSILSSVGLGLSDVVKTTIYLRDAEDFAKMNRIYAEYFSSHKPARSTVPGMDWGQKDILIEIDMILYTGTR